MCYVFCCYAFVCYVCLLCFCVMSVLLCLYCLIMFWSLLVLYMANQLYRLDPECSISFGSEIAGPVPKLRAKTQKLLLGHAISQLGCNLGTPIFSAFFPIDCKSCPIVWCHMLHSRPPDWELWQKNLQKLQESANNCKKSWLGAMI